jgi:hypothetical protein
MKDYKLKAILVVLSAIVFSMLFIILALVVPVEDDKAAFAKEKPKNILEQISRSVKE